MWVGALLLSFSHVVVEMDEDLEDGTAKSGPSGLGVSDMSPGRCSVTSLIPSIAAGAIVFLRR